MKFRHFWVILLLIIPFQLLGQNQVKKKPLVVDILQMDGRTISGRILEVKDSSIILKNDHKAAINNGLRKNSMEIYYSEIDRISVYKSKAKTGAAIGLGTGLLFGIGVAAAVSSDSYWYPLEVMAGGIMGSGIGLIAGATIGSLKVKKDPNFVYINGTFENFDLSRRKLYLKSIYRPKAFKVYYAGGPFFPNIPDLSPNYGVRNRARMIGMDFQLRDKHAIGFYYQGFSGLYREIFYDQQYQASESYTVRNFGFEYKYSIWPKYPGIESRLQVQAGAAFLIGRSTIYSYYEYNNKVNPGLNLSLSFDFYLFRNLSLFAKPSYDIKPAIETPSFRTSYFDQNGNEVFTTIESRKLNLTTFILNWGIKVHLP